jgi:VanZ family protein
MSALPTTRASTIHWEDFIIKKSAHVIEYGVLAIALYRALKQTKDSRLAGIYTLIFCMLYAMSDEFHQSFTPGRDPTVRDIIFDTIGASLAILFIWKYLPQAPLKLKNLAKRLELI